MQNVIEIGFRRRRRNRRDILGADRGVVAALIKGQFLDGLAKISGIKLARQVQKRCHRVLRQVGDARLLQGRLDLVARGRVIVDARSKGVGMTLEQFAQLGFRRQLLGGDDQLRVALLPFGQGRLEGLGVAVCSFLDKDHTGPREKTLRLDRIQQRSGIGSQIAARKPSQTHFFFALRPDERRHDFLPFQRDTHGVRAKDQKASAMRFRLGEVPRSVPARQLHMAQVPEVAISRAVMSSASITIRRLRASSSAARVATVFEVEE